MAPASTSLASAWVGTPKPGTSMPMMRTPSISFGSSRSGTPEAVGHAEIDDDDGVVIVGVGELEHRLADVLEQLAGDERLGVERHVADGAARAVEMRREGQAVDAAGRARQDRRGAPHPQADPQRAEGRAHALRLVVRPAGIIRWRSDRGSRSCRRRCGRLAHLVLAGVAAMPVLARRRDVHSVRLPEAASSAATSGRRR